MMEDGCANGISANRSKVNKITRYFPVVKKEKHCFNASLHLLTQGVLVRISMNLLATWSVIIYRCLSSEIFRDDS